MMTPTSIDDTNDMINIQSVNICKARLHLKFGFWFGSRHQIEVVDGYSMGELISNKIKGRRKKNGYFTVRLTIRGGPDCKQMWKFYGQPDRKIFVFSSPLNYFEDYILVSVVKVLILSLEDANLLWLVSKSFKGRFNGYRLGKSR